MKRFILASACLAAWALCGPCAQAQSGAVRGKVVDDKGQALEGAKVEIEFQGGVTRKYEIITKKRGEFTQVGLAPGMYKITFSKEGLQGTFVTLKIGLGEPTELGATKLLPAAQARQAAGAAKADQLTGAFKAAYDLVQAGKLDEAKTAYEAILVKEPTLAQAHFNLGYIASQKKDWPAAEAAYQKALEDKPDYGEAIIALAEAYQAQGDLAKAMAYLAQAASEHADDGRLQYRLGIFMLNQGKYPEAGAAFEKARTLDPENAEIFYQLGTIYVGQNDVAKAVESLEKYLAMKPENAQNVATAQALVAALKPKK
jgi:tetratricopeptide (TPR) repeat protein